MNHILTSLEIRLGLDMKLCRAAMCDRVATNKKALRDLQEKHGETGCTTGDIKIKSYGSVVHLAHFV